MSVERCGFGCLDPMAISVVLFDPFLQSLFKHMGLAGLDQELKDFTPVQGLERSIQFAMAGKHDYYAVRIYFFYLFHKLEPVHANHVEASDYNGVGPLSRHCVESLPAVLGDINIKYFIQASLRDLH